jgi:hypothetical protein
MIFDPRNQKASADACLGCEALTPRRQFDGMLRQRAVQHSFSVVYSYSLCTTMYKRLRTQAQRVPDLPVTTPRNGPKKVT